MLIKQNTPHPYMIWKIPAKICTTQPRFEKSQSRFAYFFSPKIIKNENKYYLYFGIILYIWNMHAPIWMTNPKISEMHIK